MSSLHTSTQHESTMHEELNEFRRHLRTLGPVQRRILQVLMPQLIALEEAGDSDGALSIIEEVKSILWEGRRTRH